MRAAIQDVKLALQVFGGSTSIDGRSVGAFGHALTANLALITAALFDEIGYLSASGLRVLGPASRRSSAKLSHRTRSKLAPEVPLATVVECLTSKRVLFTDCEEDAHGLDAVFQEVATCYARTEYHHHLMRLHTRGGRDWAPLHHDAIAAWIQAEAQRSLAPTPVQSGVSVAHRKRGRAR